MTDWTATHTVTLLLGLLVWATATGWILWLALERRRALRDAARLKREKWDYTRQHMTGVYAEGADAGPTDEALAEQEDVMKELAKRKAARESARRRA